MQVDLTRIPASGATFDVVVIGAGGAGMSAALFAAIDGARVLLVERTEYVGGTTAYSGGTTWIPGTPHAAAVGAQDSPAAAADYLDAAIGERAPAALRRAFLEHGPAALARIEANSDVRYRAYPLHPDYLSDLPGSTVKGRALEPLPFDGRKLGKLMTLVRPPIPEFTVLGGMMVDRNDIFHLLRMTKSLASFRHSARILLRHVGDRIRHPRGTRLVMGNALVGRLLWSLAQRRNVLLAMRTTVEAIHRDASGVRAVTLLQEGTRRTVRVTGGVVLASGGFNRHPQLRAAMLPGIDAAWCPGAPGHTGQAHDLARELGARYSGESAQTESTPCALRAPVFAFGPARRAHAFWAPVSLRKRADGSTAVFPHFLMDRGKPGFVAVARNGRRFVNETTSYHLFGLAMQDANWTTCALRAPAFALGAARRAHAAAQSIPAYLIADADAVRKYGIGMVRPGGKGLDAFVADGYLIAAATIEALAVKLEIDPAILDETIARFNTYADSGVDPEFGRGTTAYQRNLGDAASTGANPSLGPVATAPFYAVRLYPGDIGAATGLVTDASARVQDATNAPIAGLYAVGNDMQSVMGDVYTGPGITLGPGLVFAYLAAASAVIRARSDDTATASTRTNTGAENERHTAARR